MNYVLKSITFLILLGLILRQNTYGQTSGKRTDFQTWSDITLTYFLSQKFSIGGDVGLRGIVSHHEWNKVYIRPTLYYNISPRIKLSGGLGSFNTFSTTVSDSYEVRIFQDFRFSWPDLSIVSFYQRIRFEERLFFYEDRDIENTFSYRGSYMIGWETRNFRLIGKQRHYFLKGMWEAFVPLGKSAPELFINNQRWYAAFGFRASDQWRVELHYIWQKSRQLADNGFETEESILRLRFFHALKLPDY